MPLFLAGRLLPLYVQGSGLGPWQSVLVGPQSGYQGLMAKSLGRMRWCSH